LRHTKTLAGLRDTEKLSQAQVAKILKMTPQGYGAIERGERGLKTKYFKKLATLFKVDVNVIISLAMKYNGKLSSKTGTEA